MNEINGKIFIEDSTGKKYFGINRVTDCVSGGNSVLLTGLGINDEEWFVVDIEDFYDNFTEEVKEVAE